MTSLKMANHETAPGDLHAVLHTTAIEAYRYQD